MNKVPEMKLTPNFTLAEATKTSQPFDNSPDNDADLATIRRTAQRMEDIRILFGSRPIIVNSWYRSTAVNNAVGGVPDSQHKLGEAVDFNVKGLSHIDVATMLKQHMAVLGIDQLILEPTWVHVSFCTSHKTKRAPRNQYLDLSRPK